MTDPDPSSDPAPVAPPPRWWVVTLPNVRWRIPGALLPWGVFAVALGAELGIGLLIGGPHALGGPVGFAAALVSYALIALTIVLVVRRRGSGNLRHDLGLAFRPIDLVIGLVAFVGVQILRVILGLLVVAIFGLPARTGTAVPPTPLWFVLNDLLVACIVAPFVEEAMARGLVLRAFRDAMLRRALRKGRALPDVDVQFEAAAVGVLVSSAIFVAAHLYKGAGDPRTMLVLATSILPLALVTGVLAVATRRLGAGIVVHVLTNVTAVLLGVALLPG
jgi:membrane protease YdiL (CAAX protease family)